MLSSTSAAELSATKVLKLLREMMLDMAQIREGHRVLEIAAVDRRSHQSRQETSYEGDKGELCVASRPRSACIGVDCSVLGGTSCEKLVAVFQASIARL